MLGYVHKAQSCLTVPPDDLRQLWEMKSMVFICKFLSIYLSVVICLFVCLYINNCLCVRAFTVLTKVDDTIAM